MLAGLVEQGQELAGQKRDEAAAADVVPAGVVVGGYTRSSPLWCSEVAEGLAVHLVLAVVELVLEVADLDRCH